MNRFSCIIFDLDGTLTQTNELIYASFNHIAERYAGKNFSPAEITAMFGPPEEIAIERLVGKENVGQAIKDFNAFYETNHLRMANAYSGISDVLEFLKQKGILLAIFTGKGKRTALITLEYTGMKKYFDLVVTGDDVVHHKPSSEGIRKILKMFEVQPDESLMVGDSVSDVNAAHEAGVPVAAVVWDSYGKEKVLEMQTDFLFHSVEEFSAWLKITLSDPAEQSSKPDVQPRYRQS